MKRFCNILDEFSSISVYITLILFFIHWVSNKEDSIFLSLAMFFIIATIITRIIAIILYKIFIMHKR